ncbi:MAG: ROK family protein, partial [Pseudomonadota bacterium]
MGIDIGGTKIEVAVLTPNGDLALRERVETPQKDYLETVRAVAALIDRAGAETGQTIKRIGVGTPGSLSPATQLIRNANSTCLNGQPLDRDLAEATGCDVRLANDANCFALAEAQNGAGAGHATVFGVIIGTGVGGGVVVDGNVQIGRNGVGGEWGHNPLPAPTGSEVDGPACYCGRKGCIEAWCSGPALASDHLSRTGADMTADMIAGFAEAGDMDA